MGSLDECGHVYDAEYAIQTERKGAYNLATKIM